MRRIFSILFFTCFVCCGLSRAQTFSLQTGREPVTSLDGLWRFHTGDNPQWAGPDFDDAQWPLLRSDRSWTEQGYPAYGGYAWYRFTILVPDGSKPLALLLRGIVTGYQVYADGKLIGSAGSTIPTRGPSLDAWKTTTFRFPAGSAGPQTIQIALRVWEYQPFVTWLGAGSIATGNAAGDSILLTARLRQYQNTRALVFVNTYAYTLLASLVGLTILGLFLFRREDREYLWFAVLLLASAVDTALNIVLNLGSLSFPLCRLMGEIAEGVSQVAALVFFSIILRARRSSLWWTLCVAVAASPLTIALFYFQWTGIGTSYEILLCCFLPGYVWIVAMLTIRAFQKDTSARLLLAPAAIAYCFDAASLITRISWQLGWTKNDGPLEMPLLRSPFPLSLDDVISYIFILALLIFLVRRFSLARQEETRLSAEMEAARSVQSFLIPVVPPATPGFAVESVYIPATEVGGDFFQVQPADDGSLLIVMGDVSGKGLKAAMTVSTIIGSLRSVPVRVPADVLATFNRVLYGQISGFVTCCAALISADGMLTIANAGHLSPYRNGEEMAVEGGLPLGILPEGSYDETRCQLAPGDRLTFLSDGVVEARNGTGELYGFARTQQIGNQTAAIIAETARQFGQEDDITVVTVTRAFVPVPAL